MIDCKLCGKCCHNVSVEVDEPETDEELDEYLWLILHKGVTIYINEDQWYVEFQTPCKMLDKKRKCRIYDQRPELCKKYSSKNCLHHGEGDYFDHYFKTAEELKKHWEENYE
jgi:uncharacterized protein